MGDECGERGLRSLLLVYPYFGPYHMARWNKLIELGGDAGWRVFGLELFPDAGPYNWQEGGKNPNITALGLGSGGGVRLRAFDYWKLLRWLAGKRFDAVFINGWGSGEALALHAWFALVGVPRVVVMDSQKFESRGGWREVVKRAVARWSASAFVGGAPHRRYAEELGVAQEAIFDGCDVVDNDHFVTNRAVRTSSTVRVGTLARLVPQKNLLLAGEAFLQFCATRVGDNWIWQIAGYGEDEHLVREMVDRSGGRIEWVGSLGYDATPGFLAGCDMYWQPSLYEPWGLAVNEAMASGLPVLVSDRCGCGEDLVSSSTGWIFEPGSLEDMVIGLAAAAKDLAFWPEMGRAARDRVSRWGLDRFASNAIAAAECAAGVPSPRR